ncbi:hypothetical protein FB639_006384, partial [Coemansia asiatica]
TQTQTQSNKVDCSDKQQKRPLHIKESNEENSGDDESHEQAMLRIWAPMQPAKPDKYIRRERAFVQSRAINGSDDSYIDIDNLLSVWVCPEVKKRIQQRKIQRERALLLTQRIIGPRNAETEQQHQQHQPQQPETNGRGLDGSNLLQSRKKRRVSDSPEPGTPPSFQREPEMHSPELVKPQSLLIPELLPKSMFREAKNPASASAAGTKKSPADMVCSENGHDLLHKVPVSIDDSSSSDQLGLGLGLGLDLGFDIAQDRLKGQPEGSNTTDAIASSIHEITHFLERDIDVFTPL